MKAPDTQDECARVVMIEHERKIKAGEVKKYPRPTDVCSTCKGKVTLVYGAKTSPHWRHDSEHENHSVTGAGESFLHKEAKQRLCKFLNEGGQCEFKHHCNSALTLSPQGLTWVTERSLGKRQLDIAGLDHDGVVRWCVEICHTNASSDDEERSKLTWVEVNALKTYSALLSHAEGAVLRLEDSSQRSCCLQTREVKKKPFQPVNRIPTADDFFIMAQKLGYVYFKTYRSTIVEVWKTRGFSCNRKDGCEKCQIWDFFVSCQKCIRCTRPWETKYPKPLCLECYVQIKSSKYGKKRT